MIYRLRDNKNSKKIGKWYKWYLFFYSALFCIFYYGMSQLIALPKNLDMFTFMPVEGITQHIMPDVFSGLFLAASLTQSFTELVQFLLPTAQIDATWYEKELPHIRFFSMFFSVCIQNIIGISEQLNLGFFTVVSTIFKNNKLLNVFLVRLGLSSLIFSVSHTLAKLISLKTGFEGYGILFSLYEIVNITIKIVSDESIELTSLKTYFISAANLKIGLKSFGYIFLMIVFLYIMSSVIFSLPVFTTVHRNKGTLFEVNSEVEKKYSVLNFMLNIFNGFAAVTTFEFSASILTNLLSGFVDFKNPANYTKSVIAFILLVSLSILRGVMMMYSPDKIVDFLQANRVFLIGIKPSFETKYTVLKVLCILIPISLAFTLFSCFLPHYLYKTYLVPTDSIGIISKIFKLIFMGGKNVFGLEIFSFSSLHFLSLLSSIEQLLESIEIIKFKLKQN